jgi:hypothetical protein
MGMSNSKENSMRKQSKKPIPETQTNARKVFDLIPERELELKELPLEYEKAECGLRTQEGPPLLTQKWEALGREEES